jgi:transposase
VSLLLQSFGHEGIVANARKVRLIYESDQKNDRLDARMLTRLGRVDVNLLAPVRQRSTETQSDLPVLRGQNALVAARTQLMNAVLVARHAPAIRRTVTPNPRRKEGCQGVRLRGRAGSDAWPNA